MEEDRIEVKLFGYVLGSADGWDQVDDTVVCFYDYQQNETGKSIIGFDFPKDTNLQVDWVEGTIVGYQHNEVVFSNKLELAKHG